MLELTKGTASENIIVTLKEKQTLVNPYFLFIFTHTLTRAEVTKIFAPADELSSYTSRYNKFAIATVTTFASKAVGEWLYRAYEQASAVNTDPTLATTLLESGKLRLYPASADVYAVDQYNETQTFKAYNG